VVPRNVRLAEAPSHGIPALQLDKASKGAQAYLALAGEILRRMEAAAAASETNTAADAAGAPRAAATGESAP